MGNDTTGFRRLQVQQNNIERYTVLPLLHRKYEQDRGIKDNQVITRWCEEFNCNIAGIENRIKGKDRAWDGDYNDVLFKITATT